MYILYIITQGVKKSKMPKTFTIMKKIAKHGSQAIIVIPKMIESELKPNTIVQLEIKVIKEAKK